MLETPLTDELIPHGGHCYHCRAVSDLSSRQLGLHMDWNDPCPHWRLTAHATVRCDWLGKEAVLEHRDFHADLAMAEAALGVDGLKRVRLLGVDAGFLIDQIKVCEIKVDVPGWDDVWCAEAPE